MCTKKDLYSPSNSRFSSMLNGKRGKSMYFKDVSFMTDSIRKLASKRNTSIADTVEVLRDNSLFPKLYELVKQKPKLTEQQVANRMYKLIGSR